MMNLKTDVYPIMRKLSDMNRKQRKAFFRDLNVWSFQDILDTVVKELPNQQELKVEENLEPKYSMTEIQEAVQEALVEIHNYGKVGKRMNEFMSVLNKHLMSGDIND